MKKAVIMSALCTIFLFTCIFPVSGEDKDNDDEYIMGDISTLPVDFNLIITVSSASGHTVYENNMPVIDGIFNLNVTRSDEAVSTLLYDISFYEFDRFSNIYKDRELPFKLKRNYRGIKDGVYIISFVAKDKSGKKGKGRIKIMVKH